MKTYYTAALLAFSSFAVSTHAYAATPGEFKTFKDWAVACNNIRTCTATSLMEEEAQGGIALLRLERGGKAHDAAKLSITFSNAGLASELPAHLVGKRITLKAANNTLDLGKLTAKEQQTGRLTLNATQTQAALNILKKPEHVRIAIGNALYRGSLAGLMASLLYIDTQQQRLDTTTALVRKGTTAMTTSIPVLPQLQAVAPPPKLKAPANLAAKVRQTMRQYLSECVADEGDDTPSAYDFVETLDNKHFLVGVTCATGAYNQFHTLFIVPQESAAAANPKASLAKLEFQDGAEIVNGDFARKTGILAEYNKGRGLGDCGVYNEWVWTGKQFSALRRDVMEECRGVVDYLNVWSAQLSK
ncbi:MAG: DUF1176 domain-containing protein [Thiothrix sp.]